MISADPPQTERERFVRFLNGLAEGAFALDEWQDLVVQHYSDEVLEAARADLVRLSITHGEAACFDESARAQLRAWAAKLLL
jgi:hypothetical protein